MDTNENSTPGFAILTNPRLRSAVAARGRRVVPVDGRHSLDSENFAASIAGGLDALADGLAALEEQIDAETTLDPEDAAQLKCEVARVGAEMINARFSNEPGDALIATLRETVLTLQFQLADAHSRHTADTLEIERLRSQARALTTELQDSRRARAADRAQLRALEEQAEAFESDVQEITFRLTASRAEEVAALRGDAADLEMALCDMRSRMRGLHKENEGLKVENDMIRAQLSDTEAMLRATHSELVRTRTRLGDAGQLLRATQAELDLEQASNEELLRELNETQFEFAALSERLARQLEENGQLAAELDEQGGENNLMEQWLNGALSRYAELQIRVNELESMVSAAHLRVA